MELQLESAHSLVGLPSMRGSCPEEDDDVFIVEVRPPVRRSPMSQQKRQRTLEEVGCSPAKKKHKVSVEADCSHWPSREAATSSSPRSTPRKRPTHTLSSPKTSSTPKTLSSPKSLSTSHSPSTPKTPSTSHSPSTPKTPSTSHSPSTPKTPTISNTPSASHHSPQPIRSPSSLGRKSLHLHNPFKPSHSRNSGHTPVKSHISPVSSRPLINGEFRVPVKGTAPYYSKSPPLGSKSALKAVKSIGNQTQGNKHLVHQSVSTVVEREAPHCSVVERETPHCSVVEREAPHCSMVEREAPHCSVVEREAPHCSVVEREAPHCSKSPPSGTSTTRCTKQSNKHLQESAETQSPSEAHVPLVRVSPPFFQIMDCDLGDCRPYLTADKNHLDNYMEFFLEHQNDSHLRSYLSLMERLVSHGSYIPPQQIGETLERVLLFPGEAEVQRMHSLLQQDLCIREDSGLPHTTLWSVLEKSLSSLTRHYSMEFPGSLTSTSLLATEVILNYVFGLIVKDLNRKIGEGCLVERMLSLNRRWPRVMKLLDTLFAILEHSREESRHLLLPNPTHLLLSLSCLPLLTCRRAERSSLTTKLARELSQRLAGLATTEQKQQLLLAIPSDYLRERVISIHLESNFTSVDVGSGDVFLSEEVSLAKISCVHLHRAPYCHDGTPHNLTLFLSLLCYLLQSHLRVLQGEPLLSFLQPPPSMPLSSYWRVLSSPLSASEVQEELLGLGPQVAMLTDRLSQDETLLFAMTSPENWLYLQLLKSIIEP